MRRAASLQRRLSIGLAVGVTVVWIAATVGAGLVVRHELDEIFDAALMETAQRLLPVAADQILDRDDDAPAQRIAALGKHEEHLTYLVRNRAGKVLMRSHDVDPGIFPPRPTTGFHSSATHRFYGASAVSNTLFIEVAEPLAHRRKAAFETAAALVLPLALLVPLSLLGVWWFVRRTMRPVVAFKTEIETRGIGDLSPVAATALPAEIEPIADAVNELIERLRRALEAERSFTANSAHELRTPIAATLAQTQRLIAEAPDGPLRDRAVRIETALHRLARLSEKLMQLARAEGGGLLSETPQDMGAVLAHVVDEFRQERDGENRLNLVVPSGAVRSHLDADAFAILMRNLVENALKHGAPEGPVDIVLSEDGVVCVVNGGPVVQPEMLARLKGRFEQGATTGTGAGLGLAIAEAIAAGAGGDLDLASPAPGHSDGFEATLRLPR